MCVDSVPLCVLCTVVIFTQNARAAAARAAAAAGCAAAGRLAQRPAAGRGAQRGTLTRKAVTQHIFAEVKCFAFYIFLL